MCTVLDLNNPLYSQSFNYTRARVTRTRLFQNIVFFRTPPSAPKITPLTQLTLLQRKMAKIHFYQSKNSAFKNSSYMALSVFLFHSTEKYPLLAL